MSNKEGLRFKFVKEKLTGKKMFVANLQNEGYDDELVNVRYFNTANGEFEYMWMSVQSVDEIKEEELNTGGAGFKTE